MDYINDININEAVIHILDINSEEPVLNEYKLELTEDTYNFIYKHIEKCVNDEDLKYAKFISSENRANKIVQNYLNGTDNNLIEISKELAKQLFNIMKANNIVSSGDLLVAAMITDKGPMIAILKMDYVKNFTHQVDFVDEKIDIGIVPQNAGLPASGQKIQKAAFIKPFAEEDSYNLMVLDKQKKVKSQEEDENSNANYFLEDFLKCNTIVNERDMTKSFLKATEKWTRKNYGEDAVKAEKIRTTVKNKLKEDDVVNVNELSEELFKETPAIKENFSEFVTNEASNNEIKVDKTWVEKKLKRVRLKIDKEIDVYINEQTYHDNNKFEIQRNGDGSINLVIKHVINYIEK